MGQQSGEILGYFRNRIREAKEKGLTELDLSIPGSYYNDSKYLSANENDKLTEIPKEIFELTQLEKLVLTRNRIHSIPEAITKLTNLIQLDLRSNKLQTVPEAITKLTNLTQLYLSSNGLQTVPEAITKLTNLTQLYLRDNGLQTVPEAITKLTNLTQLYLRSNKLQTVPEAITKLTNLTQLYLSWNKLQTLPEAITKLTNLTQLDLRDNGLQTLPEAITKLIEQNLIVFDLDENPITKPSPEVVSQGLKSIRNYFWQLQKQGEDYIYEAKLIIVGEGGAGKTSLAKKIQNPDYALQPTEESTKGIDVIRYSFPILDPQQQQRDFWVNIWDFGGQEIYHTTHQFFLTKRSLYALVADTRQENTDFYYWLNVVELLSDNSPILIVNNEKQDRYREIDERKLRGEFSNLQETLATNLATKRGLPEILEAIKYQIAKLPHIGSTLPKTWVNVRQALETNPNNCISLEKYLEICAENGFDNYENKLQLSQYLHDLGVCLHFQDDPVLNQVVILKPEWGTDAVYKVLDNNEVIRSLGRFNKQDLAKIWQDQKYQGRHDQLLQLMTKFKLCYEITQQPGNYIAPQLLTLQQPDYNWDDEENLLLRYSYEFMPKGIATRFIVEMHRDIDQNLVWRNGVVIANSYAQAEVIEYYEKKQLQIKISGRNKRDFMTKITHEIDKINDSFKRIEVSKLIPCNCDTCVNLKDKRHFYQSKVLQERLAYKQDLISCDKPPFYQVKILDLIDDPRSTDSTIIPEPPKNPIMQIIKIFLASSSELESDRKEFEIFINRKNKNYIKQNLFLELVIWEDFIDAMSAEGLQSEYNKAVSECDIFVSLFHTKVGKFTEEEFNKAFETFKANQKPLIYTYFKESTVKIGDIEEEDFLSYSNFKKKLKELGHYRTSYEDINDLKYQFDQQLAKILPT